MQHNTAYTMLFALVICIVCGLLVSGAAVNLADRQKVNVELDRQRNVLEAAGKKEPSEKLSAEEIQSRFESFEAVAIQLETGEIDDSVDLEGFDQQKATSNPETSRVAPANNAGISRLPNYVRAYKVHDEAGEVEMLVLPIEGLGLWGTLYGFLALDADTTTIRGITYYQHKETPGLGGEVDNPNWKARWPGRKAYDAEGNPRIAVIKGAAGSIEDDPYHVDGLSGATITSRGVTNMLQFWLSDDGYGPFLDHFRETEDYQRAAAAGA